MKHPKYTMGEILDTDNFDKCKVIGIYTIQDCSREDLDTFVYAVEIETDIGNAVQHIAESEIVIRGL